MKFNKGHFSKRELKEKLNRIHDSFNRINHISKIKKLTDSEFNLKQKLLIKLKMYEGLWTGLLQDDKREEKEEEKD